MIENNVIRVKAQGDELFLTLARVDTSISDYDLYYMSTSVSLFFSTYCLNRSGFAGTKLVGRLPNLAHTGQASD